MTKNKVHNEDEYMETEGFNDSSENNNPEEIKAKDYLQVEDEEYSSQASYAKIIKYNAEE